MAHVHAVMRRCLTLTTTLLALGPTKVGDFSYIRTIANGFEMDYKEIDDVVEIPVDKPVIFFHPRTHDMNPDWLPPERVEDFQKFDYPKDVYLFFGPDFQYSITTEIATKAPYLKEKSRWVKIPTKKDFKSLHGHQAAAIVCWEYYKRTNPDLKWEGIAHEGDGY